MIDNPNTGVFLCQCGSNIEPLIDLNTLKQDMERQTNVGHCEIMPYSCLKPGIEKITRIVAKKKLNRVIIAGCEGRLMLKKMENDLRLLDLHRGQIDMVNLRGHIAAVSDRSPVENAVKAKKLLIASVAELSVLKPSQHRLARIDGPVMIVGGGAASFSAARELSRNKIEYFLSPLLCE